ncbi:helix-turn-helix domain-containing protein [Anaerocolumna jejuensis]|uniref:helix-turn-helix domain-containing protein n=1 Tax=Anaerocolumna jejuensis TaxID=259063 RepID=UPI003F7C2E51
MTRENSLMSKEDGIKLKIIRKSLGLSAAEFSKKTEINPSFLNLLEKGCMPLPTRDKRKIREVFGLQENWFEVIDTRRYSQTMDSVPVVYDLHKEADIKTNKVISKAGIETDKAIRKAAGIETVKETVKETGQPTADTNNQLYMKNVVINNGDILKSVRIAFGLSRKELAEAIGITSVQIGYIETGKRTLTEKVKNKLNDYFRTNPAVPQNLTVNNGEVIKDIFHSTEQNTKTAGYNVSNDEILNKIRKIKKESGYTQAFISEKSGVNRSQLSMIENGKMQISKKVKVKLLNFIRSESEGIPYNAENASISVSAEQENMNDNISDVVMNKNELFNMLESMKKTRDELSKNIIMLEKMIKSL